MRESERGRAKRIIAKDKDGQVLHIKSNLAFINIKMLFNISYIKGTDY